MGWRIRQTICERVCLRVFDSLEFHVCWRTQHTIRGRLFMWVSDVLAYAEDDIWATLYVSFRCAGVFGIRYVGVFACGV